MYGCSKIPLQLQRDREQRHQKLMKLIHSYELTREEKARLEKIKSHTMMEINLRFLRSQVNRNYKFPKLNQQKSTLNSLPLRKQSDEQLDKELKQQFQKLQENVKHKRKTNDYLAYDLKSQNGIKISQRQRDNDSKTYSTKILSLEQSRRVHSLGNDKSLQKQKQGFITKKHRPIKITNDRFSKSPQSRSTKSLKPIKPIIITRRQSKQKLVQNQLLERFSPLGSNPSRLMVDTRKLKLPQINSQPLSQSKSLRKLNPVHEKLKTQKYYEEEDIQYAIGKKLVTQIIDSGKRPMKGVEKYLKQLQAEKKKQFHINVNKQHEKIMKKDKDHQQKRKQPFQVFQSVKNSLKRQFQ